MKYRFLIASDLDGTLLPSPEVGLEPGMLEWIRACRQAGGIFCPASGRSYPSLRAVFEPVVSEVIFLAENGAQAYQNDQLLYSISMPRELCRELVAEIDAIPECEARINTLVGCYYLPKPEHLIQNQRPRGVAGSHPIKSFDEVEGEITKISAFCSKGVKGPAEILLPRWKPRIGAAITGEAWLDFTSAGKGLGLRRLCEMLGVPKENTIAFGDNYNDVSMLESAGSAYLMDTAYDELKVCFRQHTPSVLQTLRELEPKLFGTDFC